MPAMELMAAMGLAGMEAVVHSSWRNGRCRAEHCSEKQRNKIAVEENTQESPKLCKRLFVCLFVCVCVCLFCLFVCLFVCSFVRLLVFRSFVCLFVC